MPEVTEVPTIIFTLKAWMKLQGFLALSNNEVSGFGRVHPHGDNFLVDEIFLLSQEVGPTSTEIDMFQIAEFIGSLIEAGEDPELIRLWWHSHVHMGLSWSLIDDNNMRELTQTFMFGLVGRQNGEVKVRLDIVEPHVVIDDIPVEVDFIDEETREWCSREMATKITDAPPPTRHHRKRGATEIVDLGELAALAEAGGGIPIEALGLAHPGVFVLGGEGDGSDLDGYV